MHANLNPAEARVVLDNLPFQPGIRLNPDDNGVYADAVSKLTQAVESAPIAFYRHLITQGVAPREAHGHVRHRFGRTLADAAKDDRG